MTVDVLYSDHIAEITLNNPGKRNVLDLETSIALKEAVEQATRREETRAILLSAVGKAFCAGGSLDELLAAQEDTTRLQEIYTGFLAVADCPLPTLAAVQGAAVGAGMNLALACDIRLVSPEAMFDTRFLQLGIHSGGGHTWMLRRALSWERCMNALVLGQLIRGEEAVTAGLALACVPATELQLTARQQLERVATVPRELLESSKSSLLKAGELGHAEMIAHEYEVQARSLQQPHAVQTLQALKAQISRK